MAGKKKNDFLMYKDKPLVRKGNTIYYGNMSDKYVIMFQILSTKDMDGYYFLCEITDPYGNSGDTEAALLTVK